MLTKKKPKVFPSALHPDVVGTTGFEPATSASRTQRSPKLSHVPPTLLLAKPHPSVQPFPGFRRSTRRSWYEKSRGGHMGSPPRPLDHAKAMTGFGLSMPAATSKILFKSVRFQKNHKLCSLSERVLRACPRTRTTKVSCRFKVGARRLAPTSLKPCVFSRSADLRRHLCGRSSPKMSGPQSPSLAPHTDAIETPESLLQKGPRRVSVFRSKACGQSV